MKLNLRKQNLIILFAFLGHFLSGYLIYVLHQRVIYLETRDCVIEVRFLGKENERIRGKESKNP